MSPVDLECAWIDGPKRVISAFRELSGESSPAWLDVLSDSLDSFEKDLLSAIHSKTNGGMGA